MVNKLIQEKADIWRVAPGGEGFTADSPGRWKLVHTCHLGYRQRTDKAIEEGYALFEQALQATEDDPKSRRHVEAARMELQFLLLEHLPADDPRLLEEAVALRGLARELEMRSLHGMPADQYWEKIRNKLGQTLPE